MNAESTEQQISKALGFHWDGSHFNGVFPKLPLWNHDAEEWQGAMLGWLASSLTVQCAHPIPLHPFSQLSEFLLCLSCLHGDIKAWIPAGW